MLLLLGGTAVSVWYFTPKELEAKEEEEKQEEDLLSEEYITPLAEEIISLLNQEDYKTISRDYSDDILKPYLTENLITDIKSS